MKNSRISFENKGILFENSRISFENKGILFENSRISFENKGILLQGTHLDKLNTLCFDVFETNSTHYSKIFFKKTYTTYTNTEYQAFSAP